VSDLSVDGFELEKVISYGTNSDVLGVQFQSNKANVIENKQEGIQIGNE